MATRIQADSTATVNIATSSAESARAGPLTSHCTNATVEMTRKTVMGARRRKISGKISAATTHRFGFAACEESSQPEHNTKRPAASTTST